jgi:hypothetical protein
MTQFNRTSDSKTPVDATMSAYHLAFLVSIGFAIAAAFAAHFYISDKDAARTMRSHSGS